jgi:hypothetical protein
LFTLQLTWRVATGDQPESALKMTGGVLDAARRLVLELKDPAAHDAARPGPGRLRATCR